MILLSARIISTALYKVSTLFLCFQLIFCLFVCFTLSTRFLKPRSKDCTTFTLHVLTDFYVERVERVTAHCIKRNDHSCFQPLAKLKNDTKIKISLRARGAPGVSGALRILRIGRIGSARLIQKSVLILRPLCWRRGDVTVPNCWIKSLFLFYFHTKSILVAS